MHRPALSAQILAVNSLLIAATVLGASVVAGSDLHAAVAERHRVWLLVAAILATVLVNGFVLRRRLAPLEELVDAMERVDLARPGVRVATPANVDSAEVARLHESFNRMLERLEDERVAAARAVLRAQEDERARLARDLHDEVNQALTGVLLRLQATLQDAPPELADELRETRRVAADAMDELRSLAHELRPAALDDHGLAAVLRTQVDDFSRKTGIGCHLDLRGEIDDFRPDEQLVVYRVVQECLSNVARHAGAGHVAVTVRRKGGRGLVRVTDDGRGLGGAPTRGGRPPRARGGDGHGVTGMRERALQVGGRLEVTSAPGRGTTVELLLGRTAPAAVETPVAVPVGAGRRAWA
jgi:two-component system sensor histidine kinase UhpB